MTHFSDRKINELLEGRIRAGDFPSAVYLVGFEGEPVFLDALGKAVVRPESILATPSTIYDLASVTKVLVTTLLAAILIDRGELAIELALSDVLPESVGSAIGRTTILELATHTSGLPAWRPLYLLAEDREAVLEYILSAEPSPDRDVVYSDLNFILLAAIVEKLTGRKIADAASELIFKPLGLKDTGYCPSGELRRRIAASEDGNRFERETCENDGYLTSEEAERRAERWLRKEPIWGEVHDGNAYFMNGVAGHAGLFASIDDIFVIANQFLRDRSKLLKPETCELFHTNLTPGRNEHRSFAFQMATTPDSAAGINMSEQAFGHLGFTGTSLWIDPLKERVFILLTNRTHAHGLPFVNLNAVRRRFHDLAIEYLDQNF